MVGKNSMLILSFWASDSMEGSLSTGSSKRSANLEFLTVVVVDDAGRDDSRWWQPQEPGGGGMTKERQTRQSATCAIVSTRQRWEWRASSLADPPSFSSGIATW